MVSQSALSIDIDRINKEVVEGVKFQFLNKGLLKQLTPKKKNIVTSDELQEQGRIFSNAEELLNEILKNKQYKHSQNIQYLADRHESQVMKIRFVLNPFSFVFLLSGEQNYFLKSLPVKIFKIANTQAKQYQNPPPADTHLHLNLLILEEMEKPLN